MRADPADFAPPLLRVQERPPAPLAGWMLRMLGTTSTCPERARER